MAPLNTNLNTITLPPDSSSQLVIDEVWGDSQMGLNNMRLSGAWPVTNLPFVGRLLPMLSAVGTGVSLTQPNNLPTYGIRNQTGGDGQPRLRPGDAWASDGNISDHYNFSVGWEFTTTGTALRQLLIITVAESTLYTGSFPIANQALNARVFYRKTPSTVSAIRVYQHRNGSRGTFNTVNLENTGGIGWFDRSIPAANPSGGAEPAGLEIFTNSAYSAGNTLEILGVLIYAVSTGQTIVSTGYVHCPIYKSGGSPASLVNIVSDTAVDTLHSALQSIRGTGTKSVDLVELEFGHNQNGDYITTLAALKAKIAASLSRGSYDVPDYLFWATWAYDGNETRMGTQADNLFTFCTTNGYGYINLFGTYNGLNPSANGKRFDGTPATYTMDSINLHPASVTTAKFIMQDVEEHWQPENWVLPQPPTTSVDSTHARLNTLFFNRNRKRRF